MDRQRNITLIGMPGSGKSTLGRQLAQRLGYDFIDCDWWIERQYGSIPALFAQGEAHFRACESAVVRQAAALNARVIATGGGVVLRPQNMRLLRACGSVVFVDRPLAQLCNPALYPGRPLLAQGEQAVRALYAQRYPLYLQYADIVLPNAGTQGQAVSDLLAMLKEDRP